MRASLVFVVCVLCSANASAQQIWASVNGVVRDGSGAVIPRAEVLITTDTAAGTARTTTRDDGTFAFRGLVPATYRLEARFAGFAPFVQGGIHLSAGQDLRLDVELQVATVGERLEVRGAPSAIDFSSHVATTVVSQEMIVRLPKGRDFTSLVAAATPGTNDEPLTFGLQVDGSSGAENRFSVNGIDTTDLVTGTSGKHGVVDFLQEVKVETSGFSARNRVATGGNISAMVKSGSNNWRGTLGGYFDGSAFLAGSPRRELTVDPLDGISPIYVTPKQDSTHAVEPLAEIGGPVLRNRLWAYGAYDARTESTSRVVHFAENDQSQSFESAPSHHSLYTSLTSRFSTATVRFSSVSDWNRGGVDLPSTDNDGVSYENPALYPSPIRLDSGSQLFSIGADWLASPHLAVTTTTGIFTSSAQTRNAYIGYRRDFSTPNLGLLDVPQDLQHAAGYADAPRPFVNRLDDFSRFVFDSSATATFHLVGDHALTFGAQMERLANQYSAGDQSPTINFVWDDSTPVSLAGAEARGVYGYYSVFQHQVGGDVADSSWGGFIQDQWRLGSRLTLDLGVRADRETLPSYRPDRASLTFGLADEVAPRLGFVWDPTGSSTWKVSGAWGTFFDITKLELPRQYFGASKAYESFLTLDSYNWLQVSCTSPAVPGPTCPGTLIGTYNFGDTTDESDNRGRPGAVDPSLKPMRSHEFTVGLERQVSASVSARVRYVHNALDRAVEDVLVELTTPASPDHSDAVYRVVNPGYGMAQSPFGSDLPPMPRAVRNYDAIEVSATRRLSGRWSLGGSYTFSALRGNYSGLADTDNREVPDSLGGRNTPNVEAAFDELHALFDASGRPLGGRLATDRPHVFKAQATYEFPWGTSVGANIFLSSGTPLQRYLFAGPTGYNAIFYDGRLSDGRTPPVSSVDLLVGHGFRLPHSQTLELELTVLNLFDSKTPIGYQMSRFLDGFYFVPDQTFFSSWNPEAVAAESGIQHDPSFGLADAFQTPRVVRAGVRFRF